MKLVCLQGFIGAAWATSEDGTDITDMLNGLIQASNPGSDLYNGGTGIIVRAPDFEHSGKVVASTFWSNDIYAPSQFYPTRGNVWFPNDGSDGYDDVTWQTTDLVDENGNTVGPWKYASVGAVVGTSMNELYPNDFDNIQAYDWGWGVFYAKDANAADQRCEWWDDNQGYDCPGGWLPAGGTWESKSSRKGAGDYPPGNPSAFGGVGNGGGGGAGCHFGHKDIDQPDSSDSSNNLVGDSNCQCNYDLNGNDWADWFWAMVNNVKQKPGYESSRPWLGGSGNLAPSWAMDATLCWVSNPRDLIKMQNQLYWNKEAWNNQRLPKTDWSSGNIDDLRTYWGWNEIPVERTIVDDPMHWDAVMIKLPAAICGEWSSDSVGQSDSANCLGNLEKKALDDDLDLMVKNGNLVPGMDNIGNRPGSYIVFAREWGQTWSSSTLAEGELGSGWDGINWSRWFYCESITLGTYQIVHMKPSDDPNGNGACYIQYAGGPSPTPSPTPTPSPSPAPPPAGAGIITHKDSGKCLGSQNSDTSKGQPLVFVACDGSDAQSWKFEDNALKLLSDDKCADSADVSKTANLMLWDCNGHDQQQFGFDESMGTIYAMASSDASLCLDVQNGGSSDENVAWLWDCNSLTNQKFEHHAAVVQSDIVA